MTLIDQPIRPVERYSMPEATPMPISHKNTTVGKTVRTFFQSTAAIVTALPALLLVPEVRELIEREPRMAFLLIAFPALSAFWTAVQNGLDGTVPTTVKDKTV